jgi:hypothetical protein
MSRRDVVRGGALLAALGAAPVLGSCAREDASTPGSGGRDSARGAAAAASEETDVDLLTAAIQDEARLLTLAAATLRRHRPLARQVQPVVTQQRAHVKVLSDSLTERPTIQHGRPPEVPTAATAALAQLRNQVSAAEQDRAADCLAATSGLLARLLASTSASHATTVETLRDSR